METAIATINESQILTTKDLNLFMKSVKGTKTERAAIRRKLFTKMTSNGMPLLLANIDLANNGVKQMSVKQVTTKSGIQKDIITFTTPKEVERIEYVRVPKEKAIEAGIYTPKA